MVANLFSALARGRASAVGMAAVNEGVIDDALELVRQREPPRHGSIVAVDADQPRLHSEDGLNDRERLLNGPVAVQRLIPLLGAR